MKVIGLDLSGPTNTADTCLVAFEQEGEELFFLEARQGADDGEILDAILNHTKTGGLVIGIDAPLRSYSSLIPGDTNGEHRYDTHFAKNRTGYIYWSLTMDFPAPGKPVDVPLHYLWYRPDGKLLREETITPHLEATWIEDTYTVWYGWETPGHWIPGLYRLEVYSEGNLVATGSFEIIP